jgi:hypothetical protein
MANNLPSEAVAVVGVIDPDANTAAALTSDYVDMGLFESGMAICLAGTLGASATIDMKVVQATDSSGTGVKDVTGKTITQLTQAGTDSDKQAVINFRAEDLDADNAFTHAAVIMTTGTATSDSAALLLGLNPRYAPASDNDLASVDSIT